MTLVFQEHRLYRGTVGRRRVIYTVGILIGLRSR